MRKGQIITSKMIKDANTINLRTILLQVDVVLFCLPWSRWMWSANVIFVNREDPQINCRLFNFLYDARLWMTGRQNCQIFGFWSIFPIQNDKKIPCSDQPTTRGLHRRMILIFPCGSQRPKVVPSVTGVFLWLLIGELGTPKLAQIFAYGKWLYPYRMLLHGVSDLDLKTRNSEDGCTFPPNIFAPAPKITIKPHFGGPFNAKPIIQRAVRKLHVNGAMKLQLYSYIVTSKYLGCVKFFPLGASGGGAQGPLI